MAQIKYKNNNNWQPLVSVPHATNNSYGIATLQNNIITEESGSALDATQASVIMEEIEDTYIKKGQDNKILWSGASYMTASQTATLSELISEQEHGIVLVFSQYASSAAQNYDWAYEFIPKILPQIAPGAGVDVGRIRPSSGKCWCKYLYVYDNKIVGNDNNSGSRTVGGITCDNSSQVMRYVLGV